MARHPIGRLACVAADLSSPTTLRLKPHAALRFVVKSNLHTQSQGLWLAALAVTLFALTIPVTRLAVGAEGAPQLSGIFVATARASLAAVFSAIFLWMTKAKRPTWHEWQLLGLVALGVVFGFPVLMSVAMRHVPAVHASVVLGILPLATAVGGALLHRQRPSPAFWLCAVAGAVLLVLFSLLRHEGQLSALAWADGLLALGMLCAAAGYAFGALLSQTMRADHVICWALLLSFPLNLPIALWTWPQSPIESSAWFGLLYLALFSQWLGFFAWYRALATGGTVRTSQVQLLQPFLSMLFAVPILGEQLDLMSVMFALAVIATVFFGRRMPVRS